MQHFIINQEFGGKELRVLDTDILHQMQKVLRFQKGDECMIMDGHGIKVKGRIKELHRKGAVIELGEREVCKAPARRLRLYCALSKKPATFELICQKATELGVTDIVPIVMERCQISEIKKPERLEMIIREACEQSERCFVPKLHEVIKLEDVLEGKPGGLILAGDPWKYDEKLSEVMKQAMPGGEINLFIGPEGGMTDQELAAVKQAGGSVFLLGDTVLRMETAAVAALSVVQFG